MLISLISEIEKHLNKKEEKMANDTIGTRFKNAWNVFRGRDPTLNPDNYKEYRDLGPA